jgi:hypothetical protein
MGDGVPAEVQREVVGDGGAPVPGGSSSSEPSTETSECEQPREGGERRRKRRRERSTSGSDEESEIADAINKFTEAYVKIENMKIQSKKTTVEHESRLATITMESHERRYKAMLETQLAMAKLVAEAVKAALDRCLDSRNA